MVSVFVAVLSRFWYAVKCKCFKTLKATFVHKCRPSGKSLTLVVLIQKQTSAQRADLVQQVSAVMNALRQTGETFIKYIKYGTANCTLSSKKSASSERIIECLFKWLQNIGWDLLGKGWLTVPACIFTLALFKKEQHRSSFKTKNNFLLVWVGLHTVDGLV